MTYHDLKQTKTHIAWICEYCPSNNNETCGPWNDDGGAFKSVKLFHKDHQGWKVFSDKAPFRADYNSFSIQGVELLAEGIKQDRFMELKKDFTCTISEKDKTIEFELLEGEIKKLRPLSIHDGVAYVLIFLPVKAKITQGKNDDIKTSYFQTNAPYFISSKKIFYLAKDESLNQEFQLPDLGMGEAVRWDPMNVIDYIETNDKVDLKDVYEQLYSQIKSLIELKSDDYLAVFALWTIGTYFYRLFEYYPYLDFSGSKGSGKTKAQVILLCLCYNARMSHKITGPNWARNVDSLNCTILIDEQEDLLEPKTEHASNLINLLNSAFRTDADQSILVSSKDLGWSSKTFDIGVPVAIAHITPLNDVTEDRAIPMKMIVSKDMKVLDAEVEQTSPKWMRLRDFLYRSYLDHFKQVESIKQEQLDLQNVTAREKNQIWKPILTLARLFERNGVVGLEESVKKVIIETHQMRTINNQSNNRDIQILEYICDLFAEKKIQPITSKEEHKNWYQQQTLLDKIVQDPDLRGISSKELGAVLDRLQLVRRKKNPHNTCIFIDRQILINLCQRYHLEYEALASQSSLLTQKSSEQNATCAPSAQNIKIDELQFSEQDTPNIDTIVVAHQALQSEHVKVSMDLDNTMTSVGDHKP